MLRPTEENVGPSESAAEPAPRPDFEHLYRRYGDYVSRCLRRLGIHGSQIEDAAQDVFFVMHRRLQDLRPGASPKAFLFAIALRVANDYRRTLRRKATTSVDVDKLVDSGRTPFEWAARFQAEHALQRFLGALDHERRAVFLLAELDEMTAPEISRALHVNLSTVYTRLRAARQRFAAYLDAGAESERTQRSRVARSGVCDA